MSVDICIVNFHSTEDIRGALAALGVWRHGSIWLVDNSNNDEEIGALSTMAEEGQARHLIRCGRNLGFGEGCNRAFALSTADYFFLLNPDARISGESLLRLVEWLVQHPAYGAVSPTTQWNTDGSFVISAPVPQTPVVRMALAVAGHWPFVARHLSHLYVRRERQLTRGRQDRCVNFLVGALLLLRRSAVMQSGGLFRSEYFMFFEDTDLSRRLTARGWRLGIAGAVRGEHAYRHKAYKASLLEDSARRYFADHFPRWVRGFAGFAWKRVQQLPFRSRSDWIVPMATEIHSAGEFREVTGGAGVLALSPSPLLVPCIFRDPVVEPAPLTDDDWTALEPGTYFALMDAARSGSAGSRWVRFVRG
jgi:GT2 family glycosyltransferase